VCDRIEHRPASHGDERGRVCVFVCVFVCAGRVWGACRGGLYDLPVIKLANTPRDGPAPLPSPRWQALLPAHCASPAPTVARAVSAFILAGILSFLSASSRWRTALTQGMTQVEH
jgi:hypothetical protein